MMKPGKKITEIFEEGGSRLTVQPSQRAWKKLERRLDRQPKRLARMVVMQWLIAIAASMVLVASVWVINNSPRKSDLSNLAEPAPSHLQDLVTDDACNTFCFQIVQRKSLPNDYKVTLPRK